MTRADSHIRIRVEDVTKTDELSSIRAVNTEAFGGSEEADLVDNLRSERHALISLVAEREGAILGHILFSRMWIDTAAGLLPAVALAPMAVLPKNQRTGIGSLLVQNGLQQLRASGEKIVIVVGHPEYYPRFGFSSAQAQSLKSPFPEDAFMALELQPGALERIEGSVVYPPAFGL